MEDLETYSFDRNNLQIKEIIEKEYNFIFVIINKFEAIVGRY